MSQKVLQHTVAVEQVHDEQQNIRKSVVVELNALKVLECESLILARRSDRELLW